MIFLQEGGSGWLGMLIPIALIIFVFYFLMYRPEKKRRQERQAMLEKLEKNDKIITIGGIYGTVKSLNDKEVVILIDDSSNTRIKVARSAIQSVESEKTDQQS